MNESLCSPPKLGRTLPGYRDQALQDLEMTSEERKACFNLAMHSQEQEKGGTIEIGGYPDYVPGDPKLEAHLVSHGLDWGTSRL